MEAYVGQTGTVEASAARPLARRKGVKLKSQGDFSGSFVERRLLTAAAVAVCVVVEAIDEVQACWSGR